MKKQNINSYVALATVLVGNLEICDENRLKENVIKTLSLLSDSEEKVIRYRYGLEDGYIYTLKEVGEKMGVTAERIRQIQAKAIRHLKHPSLNGLLYEGLVVKDDKK